jgi:hypothetical protein
MPDPVVEANQIVSLARWIARKPFPRDGAELQAGRL